MGVLALFALGSSVAGDASAKGKKAKVTISVTTKNQAALVKAGKVTVKVKSTAKAKVSLSATLSGKSSHFKKKTLKFKKNKKQTKTISLVLTGSGKTEAKKCGAKTVLVKGTYKKGKKKATAKKKKSLAKDSTRCVQPVKSTCDPLDPKVCMQPWPSNFYTKSADTATGVQLDIPVEAMPKNTEGTSIDPTELNRSDGFSPGNLVTVKIPQVETPAAFSNSGIVPATDMGKYDDPGQAVMVIDAETGVPQPIYAELDANPTTKPVQTLEAGKPPVDIVGGHPNDDPTNTGDVNLLIRAAKNYTPGHRYVVVLRNLKDASNNAVDAPAPFKSCRDGETITDPALLYRCNQLNDKVFPVLASHGISKTNLYMAWDFTVASQENTTGRAVEIRDDAFARLGDTNLANRTIEGSSPDVDVVAYCDLFDTATPQCGNGAAQAPVPNSTYEQRTVRGFIRNVPCYLDANGCATGSKFAYDSSGKLTWNTGYTMDVPFLCFIPRSVVSSGTVDPGGTGIYGHGLLGSLGQVRSSGSAREIANVQNSSWCAGNWDGFSDSDFGTVAASLKDLSNFSKLTDRMQQGFVNFMMLQRALAHPNGFAVEDAFKMDHNVAAPITPGSAIDTSAGAGTRGFYQGHSQGGIMGGAYMALAPDVDRGVLGVPGINYSTLLTRSVDFDEYAHGVLGDNYIPGVGLYDNYPNKAELPLILSIMQILWDRGEGNGYAQTLNPANSPLPNTNPHTVLLAVATGDHQVANITAEVEARTIGAKVYSPMLQPSRIWPGQGFGIPTFTAPLSSGNAMVYYDGGPPAFVGTRDNGTKPAPIENVPPRPQWGFGDDPHGFPRNSPEGQAHEVSFLNGGVVGPCAGATYCYSNGWDGVTGLP